MEYFGGGLDGKTHKARSYGSFTAVVIRPGAILEYYHHDTLTWISRFTLRPPADIRGRGEEIQLVPEENRVEGLLWIIKTDTLIVENRGVQDGGWSMFLRKR